MDLLSNPFNGISLKRQWRRRKYKRLNGSSRKNNVKIVKFGGDKKKRAWKIRAIPKLRLKFASPLRLWKKFKNAYMNLMLSFAGNVGAMNCGNVFAGKSVTNARQASLTYKNSNEIENRLIYEIYKSLVVSMEMNPR
ncbi:hypothetical protein ACH5RR_011665 [Cinchona calisaya]|uniref:Uncharacterized protein n=1 Tax=Cinchona calisaya TaxID=153742 RepID=A0ABD3A5J9_9GENT